MKKIDHYQCDFCTISGPEEEIEKHEKECDSDPTKKKCDSCKYYNTYLIHGLYYEEECSKGLNSHISDVRFDDKTCSMWSQK
jgi:hypothetical protein